MQKVLTFGTGTWPMKTEDTQICSDKIEINEQRSDG